jgi:hypothetical protein
LGITVTRAITVTRGYYSAITVTRA